MDTNASQKSKRMPQLLMRWMRPPQHVGVILMSTLFGASMAQAGEDSRSVLVAERECAPEGANLSSNLAPGMGLVSLDGVSLQDKASEGKKSSGKADKSKKDAKIPNGVKRRDHLERRYQNRLKWLDEQYTKGEKTSRCIPVRRFSESTIIDDDRILFEVGGNRAFMAHLRGGCPNLFREDRFAMRVYAGSMCSGDMIDVLDTFGRSWGACAIGDVYEYARIPRAEREARRAAKKEQRGD